jgi:glutamine cyclotransferase
MKKNKQLFLGYLVFGVISAVFSESPFYSFEIINSYPHDPAAFTQGLVFEDGFLYESTGLKGASSLRKVELETGRILQIYHLPGNLFAEGICLFEDKIIQLTWQAGVGFVYEKKDFTLWRRFHYSTEGWGITYNGSDLIMSDGSHKLYFLNPQSFKKVKEIEVREGGELIKGLNELEYVEGKIYANIWPTSKIAIISISTGKIKGWIDLSPLLEKFKNLEKKVDVLNGIAYDKKNKRLFITGKYWPQIFEIKLKLTPSSKGVKD